MQRQFPDGPDGHSDNLPAHSDERKVAALTVARHNQYALSLDLQTGLEGGYFFLLNNSHYRKCDWCSGFCLFWSTPRLADA